MARPQPPTPETPAGPAPSRSRTIPSSLHGDVTKRLAESDPATGRPYTARAIAAWLEANHGVKCSHMAVLRVAAAASEKGEQIIVAALREELRDAVGPARRRLEQGSKRLADLLPTEKNVSKVAAGVRALTGALDSLTKVSGVAKPLVVDLNSGGKPLADPYAQLAAAVARLAAEPEQRGSGEADPEPPA